MWVVLRRGALYYPCVPFTTSLITNAAQIFRIDVGVTLRPLIWTLQEPNYFHRSYAVDAILYRGHER